MEVLVTDGGPPYSSHEFTKYVEKKGIKHHLCAPENPMANGFVEVFQKVLAKMVHTAVAKKKDPRRVIDHYLMAYRAAPHKTTGLSPYEMMFGRKMRTKLPQNLQKRKGSDREEEARAKHDEKKKQQKKAFDARQKAKEKKLKAGDEILIQQQKTSVKSPWDPEGFQVKEVKGSKGGGDQDQGQEPRQVGQEETQGARDQAQEGQAHRPEEEERRVQGRQEAGEEEEPGAGPGGLLGDHPGQDDPRQRRRRPRRRASW
jgi:hypothetical protein